MHSYDQRVKDVVIYLCRVLSLYAPELIHLREEGNNSRELRADVLVQSCLRSKFWYKLRTPLILCISLTVSHYCYHRKNSQYKWIFIFTSPCPSDLLAAARLLWATNIYYIHRQRCSPYRIVIGVVHNSGPGRCEVDASGTVRARGQKWLRGGLSEVLSWKREESVKIDGMISAIIFITFGMIGTKRITFLHLPCIFHLRYRAIYERLTHEVGIYFSISKPSSGFPSRKIDAVRWFDGLNNRNSDIVIGSHVK